MKQLFFRKGRILIFFGLLLFSFIACQEDNDLEIPDDSGIPLTQNVTTRVTASDIPEIMDFVAQKADARGLFTIQAIPGTREADLTGVSVDSLDILVNTNDADLSNYSFKMEQQEENLDNSFLNLVIKETSFDVYGYIVKYRPDPVWLSTQSEVLDFNNYTGDILLYQLDGTFVTRHTFTDSMITNRETVDPCENNQNNGGNTGGGGSTGGGGNGNSGGGGGGGNGNGNNTQSGGGGDSISCIVIEINDCTCSSGPGQTITVSDCDDFFEEQRVTTQIFRSSTPCEECYDDNNDPCTCASDGVSCDTGGNGNNGNNGNTEENEEVGVNEDQNIFTDPCESLNELSGNAQVVSQLNALKSDADDPTKLRERGFEIRKDASGNTLANPIRIGNLGEFDYRLFGNVFGGAHTHPIKDRHPMYSAGDITGLMKIKDGFTEALHPAEFVHFLVTNNGSYALKIENFAQFSIFKNVFFGNEELGQQNQDFLNNKLDEKYNDLTNNGNNPFPVDYQKVLLKLLKEFEDMGFPSGISFYKAENEFTEWKKLELDDNGNVDDSNDC